MKTSIALVVAVLMSTMLFAQTDTLSKDPNEIVEVYDVVAVYKETQDGRGRTRSYVSQMKGEIVNYDETTGVLTFRDTAGRMYSFKSGEYKYFEYDKVFTKKVKKVVLRPRKESGIELSAGFRASFISFTDEFTSDDYYLNSSGGATDLPISIYLGASKYFGRKHSVGVNGEIALTSYGNGYLSAGLRYCHQYDAYKRNVAFYLPVELSYFRSRYDESFQINDTIFDNTNGGTSYSYPGDLTLKTSLSAMSLSLGQGFGFILNDQHSLSIELALVKYFPFSTTFEATAQGAPNVQYSGNGVRLSVIMNL